MKPSLKATEKNVNLGEQLVDCPEQFVESKIFRFDNRVSAGGESRVESRLDLTHNPAAGVNPTFSEGDEFRDAHPFSGFSAFMD
ncbi:hypothetical protein RI103_10180 [Paraburkholderia sp. FT54]|uniref:hypothetical protein n=1 Tax=Paraburkholderia sp. FT54 TaxID=3074437 RepID=UPI002877CA36|nr:hypothetical protein [Paraburkholderia sp. FT54]WNC88118.1 hypothetical protein RI103_10180 [Paraburkholderia sp. FT54]